MFFNKAKREEKRKAKERVRNIKALTKVKAEMIGEKRRTVEMLKDENISNLQKECLENILQTVEEEISTLQEIADKYSLGLYREL